MVVDLVGGEVSEVVPEVGVSVDDVVDSVGNADDVVVLIGLVWAEVAMEVVVVGFSVVETELFVEDTEVEVDVDEPIVVSVVGEVLKAGDTADEEVFVTAVVVVESSLLLQGQQTSSALDVLQDLVIWSQTVPKGQVSTTTPFLGVQCK